MTCPGTAWLRTEFPDGTVVDAHPNHGPEDIARAEALGYPSVQEMTLDHDLFHQLLANALFGSPSRVVTATEDPEFAAAEEGAVLAMQRYMQAARKAGIEAQPFHSRPRLLRLGGPHSWVWRDGHSTVKKCEVCKYETSFPERAPACDLTDDGTGV